MTDNKSEMSQDDRARSKSPVLTTPANKRVPPSGAPDGQRPAAEKGNRSMLAPAALVLALIAAGLSGLVWVQQRQAQDSHAQLVEKLSSNAGAADRAGVQAQDALGRLQAQEQRINGLQTQLDEAATIIRDLDEALRSMTERGSEIVLLNDVDHLVTIAQQQLQLGGNVRNAIVALESAQAQLSRANRPALASLLQTINGDLDRLRAASTIDMAVFSRQLEELAMLLSEAPLIMPDEAGRRADRSSELPAREQPAPTVPPARSGDQAWWKEAWETTRDWSSDALRSMREDLGQFIDVRRVDDANALLMSPDQAARFRENLRTRIMTAQLALMMRQPEIWKAETEAVVRAIETRYDEASPLTRKALRMARSMADASIDTQLPTVDNTLRALNTLREEQSRGFGSEPAASGQQEPAAQEADEQEPAEPGPAEQDPGTQESLSQKRSTPSQEPGTLSQEPGTPAQEPAPQDGAAAAPTSGRVGG